MMTESTSPTAPPVSNGTAVSVGHRKPPVIRVAQRRRPVVLPLVPSDKPGSVDMTAERIAEILEKQDARVPCPRLCVGMGFEDSPRKAVDMAPTPVH